MGIDNKYLIKLKEFILEKLRNDDVKIILFGSRARGDNYVSSDIDIGIISKDKVDDGKIAVIKEKIENLNIPYKVEIVNFSHVSDCFKQEAMKEAIVWKDWR
ncbi:MAG: nucleotidyltransferase domain-containing protein [Candidatus Omnitrophota bacterium]|nr:nucleotidyltransferase domain-containing protein [Candidatus Omnitrophota bacterium]